MQPFHAKMGVHVLFYFILFYFILFFGGGGYMESSRACLYVAMQCLLIFVRYFSESLWIH